MTIENACIKCEFLKKDPEISRKNRIPYAKCSHDEAKYMRRENLVTGVTSHSLRDCDDMRKDSGVCGLDGLLFMEKKSLFKRLFRA